MTIFANIISSTFKHLNKLWEVVVVVKAIAFIGEITTDRIAIFV